MPNVNDAPKSRLRREFALSPGVTELKEFSPLSFCLERLFFLLQWISPANWLFGSRKLIQDGVQNDNDVRTRTRIRGRQIEAYIVAWALMIAVAAVFSNSGVRLFETLALYIAAFRLLDILQVGINITLFDHIRVQKTHYVSGITRTLLLSVWNFFEIMLCYGVIYSSLATCLENVQHWYDPYYFSLITQLTIGYGDLKPIEELRLVAATQGGLGFVFGILVLARFVTLLPKVGSVQLIDRDRYL